MTHAPSLKVEATAVRVSYSSYLIRAACADAWDWVGRHRAQVAVTTGVIFFGAAFLVWLVRGGEAEFLAPALAGVVAILLGDIGLLAAHLLYLAPRKLCAAKQQQLEAERRKFAVALEKEKQTTHLVMAERDVLKARLEERPLRPLELREEIDQLMAEAEALLESEESTMIGESELWFDDVERFAKRHLSPSQYDQLHAAALPDPAEKGKRPRSRSGSAPVLQEESAVAERLMRINAGLRELRQGIGG
ncbi:MAG: hypothetical protein ABJF10_26390 [Chthoniobacter sp.]|uniref:hypothetical protein n=1 Tax=Chthoniobacter sp. TaxID=2510640 RepID=UPI0032A4779F